MATTVMCPWIMCKYNSGTVGESPGICQASEIDMGDVDIGYLDEGSLEGLAEDNPTEEIEDSLLNCRSFVRDNTKAYMD